VSWYKVERGWLDNPFFQKAEYSERDAWQWMIGEAAYEDCRISVNGRPFDLGKGQLYSSIRFMAQKFQWSTGRVTRFLERLREWGMVDTAVDTGQNLITICNYSKYQDRKTDADTPVDTAVETPTDTVTDTPVDTNKKNLKTKELKKELDIHREFFLDGNEYTPEMLFELFWNDFPDGKAKGNKAKAKEKFIKLLKSGENHENIIRGTRGYRNFCQAEGHYNQHCITWLNQRGWEGEWAAGTGIKPPAKPSAKPSAGYSLEDAVGKALADQTRRPEGREERLAALGIGTHPDNV
jgi:hypothetical protein